MRWVFIAFVAALSIFVEPTLCRSGNEAQLGTFEVVWNKVNETYFDPAFGGLNWKDVHDRYKPRIAAAKTDKEFYELVNDMLWELKASHANLIPPGSIARYEPIVFAEGSPGIDARLLNGVAVITSVKPESPAHAAGLSAGYVIQALDGIPVEQIAREAELRVPPPANSRSRTARGTKAILSRIFGAPGTEVAIVYLDKEGEKREQRVVRAKRSGVSIGPVFMAIEFEARRLDNGIGYVRLNTLQPQLAPRIAEAIKAMGNMRGIILDLRGNSGGEIENMPELFVKERTLLYLRTSRDGEAEVFSNPADSASAVPLVLLIDALSGSASELISACLQSIGRAVIVGERSPGAVLESDTMILPNGAIFMYPVARLRTPDGTVLEGRGVVPDIEVGLDREMLLKGVDSQLDSAIRYIEEQKK
jgi:carboxyl-terminal processing protease